MRLNDYFDAVYVINLNRRWDKWSLCNEELVKHQILATRFEGHDLALKELGNTGCTASHRGVLELICHHGHKRTLVLEDDFQILHDDFNQRFECMLAQIPDNWDMLYLGGHYAEKPQARISKHVIKIGAMLTTSSYAINYETAREIAPFISGNGPIDTLYFDTNRTKNCYIFQPRLMVQRPCFSDIVQKECNNSICMQDTLHEGMV